MCITNRKPQVIISHFESQITHTQLHNMQIADTQTHRCTDAQKHRYTARSTQITDRKKTQNHNSQITNKTVNNELQRFNEQ